MSNNTSSLFLSELSIVDHAYINNEGIVVGGSFNPSFLVTGEMDPIEQVVVDFSTIKKDIKAAIDHKDIGFDHKLWFIDGYSAGTIAISDKAVVITTQYTTLNLPLNAVKYVQNDQVRDYNTPTIGIAFAELVQDELAKKYPAIDITVECINTENAHFSISPAYYPAEFFTYSHGLKDSTSWGCQNIAHGHLSFLQLETELSSSEASRELCTSIAQDISSALFVNPTNIKTNDDVTLVLEYETPRGLFQAAYAKSVYNIHILETETTVEHLVAWVASTYKDQLSAAGVTRVWMSEGLSKGSFITL